MEQQRQVFQFDASRRDSAGGFRETPPSVGVALGGGAARGLAHIGVLQFLESRGVQISHVAGCSMGSVIGAAYACGTLDWLQERSSSLGGRNLLRLSSFWAGRAPGTRSVHGGSRRHLVPARFSAGFFEPELLYEELYQLTRGLKFEQLPIRLALVATDLKTGDSVCIDHGDVATAVLASMSVPGLFPAVELDGKLLVDGGLTELVPISLLRAMNAPLRIAVDVSSERDIWTRLATGGRVTVNFLRRPWHAGKSPAKSSLPSPLGAGGSGKWSLGRTLLAAFDITEGRMHRVAGRYCRPDGDCVLITPNVDSFNGHEFGRAREIIRAGWVAAAENDELLWMLGLGRSTGCLREGA